MANGQTARKREAPATAVMRRHRSSEPASSRPSQIQADRAALVRAPRSGPLSPRSNRDRALGLRLRRVRRINPGLIYCSLRLRPNRPIRGAGRVRSGPRHERRASRGRAPSILRSRWAPLTGIAAGLPAWAFSRRSSPGAIVIRKSLEYSISCGRVVSAHNPATRRTLLRESGLQDLTHRQRCPRASLRPGRLAHSWEAGAWRDAVRRWLRLGPSRRRCRAHCPARYGSARGGITAGRPFLAASAESPAHCRIAIRGRPGGVTPASMWVWIVSAGISNSGLMASTNRSGNFAEVDCPVGRSLRAGLDLRDAQQRGERIEETCVFSDGDRPLRVCLRCHGWLILRRSRLPMATWIMASETSRRCS